MENTFCRVCGLDQEISQWTPPKYQICFCCGVQFGVEDDTLEQVKEYRKNWRSRGGDWFNRKFMPPSWKLQEQLKHITSEWQ